jgi:hypothetical protein
MVRRALVAVLCLAFVSAAEAKGGGGSHSVRGYTTKNGTHVTPHHATNPDSSKLNNWSTKGNVNPYTGKKGTKDPAKR